MKRFHMLLLAGAMLLPIGAGVTPAHAYLQCADTSGRMSPIINMTPVTERK